VETLNLRQGKEFRMGKGHNWRVIHPDMGATQLTLNHGIHEPGHEFPQHTHDDSEDCFIILEGGVSVRQGDKYTPVSAGDAVFVPGREVHGTVNTTDKPARLMSFQSPPDMALYRGARQYAEDERPVPKPGTVSAVQISAVEKGGPAFGKPGDWRSVVSADRAARHLIVDYIKLGPGEGFDHEPEKTESFYVLVSGGAQVKAGAEASSLKADDVVFLKPGDACSISQAGEEPLTLIRVQARG